MNIRMWEGPKWDGYLTSELITYLLILFQYGTRRQVTQLPSTINASLINIKMIFVHR